MTLFLWRSLIQTAASLVFYFSLSIVIISPHLFMSHHFKTIYLLTFLSFFPVFHRNTVILVILLYILLY